VRVLANRKNIGRSASLNKLNSLARGKYIARLDADDMCSKTRIQRQVDFMESHPEVDIVGTEVCYLDRNHTPIGRHFTLSPSHDKICRHPSRMLGIIHGTILGKREWFQKNPYDEALSISVDCDLFLRTYKHSTFANITEPLYYYRLDQSFVLKKQFHTRRTNAKLLFQHYGNIGCRCKACANWALQYGKFVATVLMFATGLRKKLMAKRYDPTGDRDLEFYEQEVTEIRNTELPIVIQ
jgi:glycosyltransferase involved in cell wall biosynthesis